MANGAAELFSLAGRVAFMMLPLGLVEVSRTGIVAIQRGPEGM